MFYNTSGTTTSKKLPNKAQVEKYVIAIFQDFFKVYQ